MNEESIKCFRCGAQPKILVNMTINEATLKLCPQCFSDLGFFLQGNVIDRMVRVERGHRIRKEDNE